MVDAERDMAYFERSSEPTWFRKFKNAIKNLLPSSVDEAVTPFFSRIQRKLGQINSWDHQLKRALISGSGGRRKAL